MKLNTITELYLHELADLYDAEKQLVKALPKLAKAASDPRLKEAFEQHLGETEGHVERLDTIIGRVYGEAPSKRCKAMRGLIEESDELVNQDGDPSVLDAALIGAAQRVEHYEIAAYGCARTYAELLGDNAALQSLSSTLEEERAADTKLNELAKDIINPKAAAAG
jgi:ferritin-like metal-binding protein YciE